MDLPVSNRQFRFALSFAGEYREIAMAVANLLRDKLNKECVFYDEHHQSRLGKNAVDYLQNVYGNQSDVVLVFFGPTYLRKPWCRAEFKAIKRMISSAPENKDRVLFIRCEDGDFPYLKRTRDISVDARKITTEKIATLAMDKYLHIQSAGNKCKYKILVYEDNREQLISVHEQLFQVFKDEPRYEVSIDLTESLPDLYQKNRDTDYDVYILDVATRKEYVPLDKLNMRYGDHMYHTLIEDKPNKDIIPLCYVFSRLSAETIAYQFYDTNRGNNLKIRHKGEVSNRELAMEIRNALYSDYLHAITPEDKTR